jgi:hypothetical protein
MALFGPKGFAAEVTEGIDLESRVTLTGERITVGTGMNDDLCLGAGDIVGAHLSFQRREDGKWEYFTSDRGQTEIDKGNPRTGLLRAGMWFRIGHETKITIKRAALPEEAKSEGSAMVPLSIAIPAMVAVVVFVLAVVLMRGGSDTGENGLRTAAWYSGAADMTPALETCLSHDLAPPASATVSAADGAFWTIMALPDKSSSDAREAKSHLHSILQGILSETHLLSHENRNLEASHALRRIEYVLPLGRLSCPILSAARVDLALLELRGN